MKFFACVCTLLSAMLCLASSFDLFGSLDDARQALESFYTPAALKSKAKVTSKHVNRLKPLPPPKRLHFRPFAFKDSKVSVPAPKKTSFGLGPKLKALSSKVSVPAPKKTSFGLGPKLTALSSKVSVPASKTKTKGLSSAKKPKRATSSKFFEAIDDIEKALADAQIAGGVTHDERRVRKLLGFIKTAVQKRSYRFARKTIGEAMFTIAKINEKRKNSGRGKRSTVVSAKDFLGNVRRRIGQSDFDKLLAMHGDVTLVFAIDDTGSMQEEIDTAKDIAQSIVNTDRAEAVDYILSPFNDPGTGPLKYYDEGKRGDFIQDLKALRANLGGDCPELAFKGMMDAIDVGQPKSKSPVYVFTDDGPKDATSDNIDFVLENAMAEGCVFNFFLVDSNCGSTRNISAFKLLAQKTFGQVFNLKNVQELSQLKGLTASSLGGTAVVTNAKKARSVRRKRNVGGKQINNYSITVDDSIENLIVSFTADQSTLSVNSWSVSLTNPSGRKTGTTSSSKLDKGAVYQISQPNVGVWNLGITADSSVSYDFIVKGSSVENIDFEFYFVKKIRKKLIPISSPVLGEEAEAILTVSGVANIDANSLKVELMTLEGQVLPTSKKVSLTSKDKRGVRYSFKFTPPNQVFQIKLKGRTKTGNPFERASHKNVKPETLLIKILYGRNEFTIAQGTTGFVIFQIRNFGNTEGVDLKAFGNLAAVEHQSRKSVVIRKNRRTSFYVRIKVATKKATKGMTVRIVASVKGKTSGSKSRISVPLLVV